MLTNAPAYLTVIFTLTVLLTMALFYSAIRKSTTHASKANLVLGLTAVWAVIHSILALQGFYSENTMTVPPRFLLLFAPVLLLIVGLFLTKSGRSFIDGLSLRDLTIISIVRIPVEFCLYWLFLAGAVPELMTFAGRNFDILAGITAPIIYFVAFGKDGIRKGLLTAWNVISLCLLLFIIANAMLSAPIVIQQFSFDNPNIGIMYWPFNLLPAVVVPIVLFTHFASLRQLLRK